MVLSNDDSNAQWLYHQCCAARTAMETPLSPLQLAIKVLQFVKSIDEDADDVNQMELFKFLKEDGKAKRRDLSFVFEISERAVELRDDEELTEEALTRFAPGASDAADDDNISAVEIGGGSADGSGGDNSIAMGGDFLSGGGETSIDAVPTAAATTFARPQTEEDASNSPTDMDDINFDELHCFQLRTRVLGLEKPTFSDLWRYLQAAGWTYLSGKYHIPKGSRKKGGSKYSESMAKRIYKHFNLDNNACEKNELKQLSGDDESDEEEGPETFSNSNDLVEYLDEFCMPDYRATSTEIEAQRIALSQKSNAYKRRNMRLRFELLEVAYRERVGKSHFVDGSGAKSKYGHNHRPCEVCFKGANHLHPRVACRECGLVTHTYCYGLLDHGDKAAKKSSGSRSASSIEEVDEKGFFTCDVCTNSLAGDSAKKKMRWHASQSSGWRVHDLPNAVCLLCHRKDITGAMVKIVVGEKKGGSSGETNSRKRKSRSSAESSEHWVHLFCINSLPSSKIPPSSIRRSIGAAGQIRKALELSSEIVKETESMREKSMSIRCQTCTNRKGDLVECKGGCERFFHRLCLQIDCLDVVGWNAEKEHLCLLCRSTDGALHPGDSKKVAAATLDYSSKPKAVNARQQSSNANAQRQDKNTEEIDQYFKRTSGKKSRSEGVRSDIIMPSQQDCVAEVESLYRQSNVAEMFDEFEVQYEQHFYEWSFSMATNQSILLYGLGSKTSVLTSFGQYLSAEGDVVSLNGYDPNIDLNQFLDYMDQLFCGGSQSNQSNPQPSVTPRDLYKGMAKKAALIAKRFASTRSRPLFVLIHNIDGACLRNSFSQDAISTLTSNSRKDGLPLIRVAASVDNVNSAMALWSPQVEHKFDWAWKKVHTYRPYFEEVRNLPQTESSKKIKKRGIQNYGSAAAVLKVLAYLAPRHTEVLQLLAALQLSRSSSISYHTLRDECVRKMLTATDSNLRTIMKELFDHKIIGSEKDDNGVEKIFIPPAIPLEDILNFKPKQN